MRVLGVWDGHDAGAALVEDGLVKVAVNEERYSKRKLHVGFPHESIKGCLEFAGLKPGDVDTVAFTTTDFAKTLTRAIPGMKDSYYMFRRRKIQRPRFIEARRQIKYRTTEIPELPLTRRVSKALVGRDLKKLGFKDYRLEVVGHHEAHAAAAALSSGFDKSIVITLDGIGDGLSGTVNLFEGGELKRLSSIAGRDSFGIFYEQVTSLLGMRELEDEGKVMALSNFAYDIPEDKNVFIPWFSVDGINVKCKLSTVGKYKKLADVLWNTPREDVAYMAQKTLEKHITQLFKNAIAETGVPNVVWSGGVASNIKVNMKVKALPELKDWFVFPHMGDGGLAVGAALYSALEAGEAKPERIKDVYWGPEYSSEEAKAAIKAKNLKFEERSDAAEHAGELVSAGNFLLWYQGRMEFGPRALGNRSIVGPAGNVDVKDKLNLEIKERDWFQPFCPSLLAEEADRLFEGASPIDSFMTMGYMTREEHRKALAAVVNVDQSARPQMLRDENAGWRRLIEKVKSETGYGIVLNTSFNIHGFPIVRTPADAVDMLLESGAKYMVLGDYVIQNG